MLIKTWRDPYEAGFSPTKPTQINIESGVTVLVGCNGAGKTTLINNIEDHCKSNKIPVHKYDNMRDDGSNSFGAMLGGCVDIPGDSIGFAAGMMSASEGEALKMNIGRQSTLYKEFFRTGHFKNKSYRISKIFSEMEDSVDNRRVLLFDATDSGMSIDSVCEIKSLFNLLIEDAKEFGIELYVIIAANEYELCREESCFDVIKGKYITFSDYEDYRKFILHSRQLKENRLKQQEKWAEKQKEKEQLKYDKLKTQVSVEVQKARAGRTDEELSMSEKVKISHIEDKLRDFERHVRFITIER